MHLTSSTLNSTNMREVLTIKFKQKKRRAVELYDADSPFKSRVERDRKNTFERRPKHVNKWREEI